MPYKSGIYKVSREIQIQLYKSAQMHGGKNFSLSKNVYHLSSLTKKTILNFAIVNYVSHYDLIVYGRKTYELMIPYWPDVAKNQSGTKAENEFAQTFTAIYKVVFSRSLDSAEGNTRIVRANPVDELLKLKQEAGKKIFNRRCKSACAINCAWLG